MTMFNYVVAVDEGYRCHMSLLRMPNVALSNLRNVHVALLNFTFVEFYRMPMSHDTIVLCRMSLRPKLPH